MDHGQGQLEKAEVNPTAATPAFPDAERHAYRDDMGDTYGAGYMTRSADEGYGERYGEAVKKVMDNKADKKAHMHQLQSGTTADRDQTADAGCMLSMIARKVTPSPRRKTIVMPPPRAQSQHHHL